VTGAMEFQVRRTQLHQLAEQAGAVVPTNQTTLNVGGCFRATVAPGRLELAATDMQRTVFAETAAVRTESSGVVFLPAKRFRSILSEAPDVTVTVTVKDSVATVRAGSPHWDMKLPKPRGYAELLDPGAVSFAPVRRDTLLTALRTVRHAVCKDTGRPAFTQVKIVKEDGGMFAWAADSSQFARAPVTGFPFETCIPAAMLEDLIKLLGTVKDDEVQAGEDGTAVVFRAGPVTLAGQGMGYEFLDMKAKILDPTAAYEHELGVDRDELLTAIRRVAVNSHPKTHAVALTAREGKLTVQARDDDGNMAEESLSARWSGGQRVLVVNYKFLADMVGAHPAADCSFRLGADQGKMRSMIRLQDPATGVTGVIVQSQPGAVRY
jgi:DNA polymerase-3 subunit beta